MTLNPSQRTAELLDDISQLLHLTDTELAALLCVSGSQLESLREHQPSASQLERLSTIWLTVHELICNIRPEHLGEVVRRPATAFNGRSLLEVMAEDPAEAYEKVERVVSGDGAFTY